LLLPQSPAKLVFLKLAGIAAASLVDESLRQSLMPPCPAFEIETERAEVSGTHQIDQ
jgi:hypothetical protein